MIDKFLSLFGVHRVGMIIHLASQVIRTFDQEFAKDHNAKNAAIDSIVEVLIQHKSAEPPLGDTPVELPITPSV